MLGKEPPPVVPGEEGSIPVVLGEEPPVVLGNEPPPLVPGEEGSPFPPPVLGKTPDEIKLVEDTEPEEETGPFADEEAEIIPDVTLGSLPEGVGVGVRGAEG